MDGSVNPCTYVRTSLSHIVVSSGEKKLSVFICVCEASLGNSIEPARRRMGVLEALGVYINIIHECL